MVLFHDLVSPHVAAGLRALAAKGWNVMAYQTAQMMGVAWRGAIRRWRISLTPRSIGKFPPIWKGFPYPAPARPEASVES